MSGVEVITGDLSKHPRCPHGPTLLFSRVIDGKRRRFYACSACRDRKLCPFFLYENEKGKTEKKQSGWDKEIKKFTQHINHRKLFLALNEVQNLPESQRIFCFTCNRFEFDRFLKKHEEHNCPRGVSDYQIEHPSEFLPPLEDSKKEAQFLFSKSSVKTIVDILQKLGYRNIICMGTPRIFEHIKNDRLSLNGLLLDFDGRYHNFLGPLEFCWYNCFNHHFFFAEAHEVFNDFLQSEKVALILDPPFGGRVEPLAFTLNSISEQYKKHLKTDLPIFWAFPYFMEPQILNSLPNFKMLDYKVDYDNHPLFQDGPKGRKLGSPVRIFTNISPKGIVLPTEEGYKFCTICQKYVSQENNHCDRCKLCTSKDGRTYIHCEKCLRCVKPTWQHCKKCKRCAQPDHKCGEFSFSQECFHCKKAGHKKRDCPEVDHEKLHKRRKMQASKMKKKQKTI